MFKSTKLENLVDISSSKRIYAKEYVDKGIPFYRSKEIIEKSKNNDVSQKIFISYKRYNEIKEKFGVPEQGDLLLTSVGTLGVPYIVKNEKFYFKDGNLTWFKNFSGMINYYLYYWFLSPYGKEQIYKKQIGSTQKALTIKDLKDFEIKVPSVLEQKKIAGFLNNLDNKIEVNNKIIENLEAQGQAIFKNWFIDFEPFLDGEFVDSELGQIPKGWDIKPLEDLSKEIVTGKTPPTKVKENYGDKMPFITIPDMHNNTYIIDTERHLSDLGVKSQIKKTLPENSICVSCIATVGLVSITSKPSQTNQQINSIVPKENISPYFIYLSCEELYPLLNAIGSSGSATKNVNKGAFKSIKIIVPDKQTMNSFHNLVKPLFEKIKLLLKENEKLGNIRDTLLPKLMSGEIRLIED